MGFLTWLIDSGKALWDTIVTFFVNLIDTVIGLALLPILGPINLFLSFVLDCICGIADAITNGMISLMTLQHFGERTLFEIIFIGAESTYDTMVALALGLVIVIYLFQLFKSMVAPPGESFDEPITLTFRTIFTALIISLSRPAIDVMFRFFGIFYSFFSGGDFSISFADLADDAKELITTGLPTIGVRAQLLTILGMIFLGIMTFSLAKTVIKYSIELVLRFTIIGVMTVTAPLGATLFPSKATRNSFTSWVRMIASQLVLVCFGIVFMRIFCSAFGKFSTSFSDIIDEFDMGNFTSLMVWTFMVNAILIIGTNVDSFLKTLGLSVAECGGAMSTALMAESSTLISGTTNFLTGALSGNYSGFDNFLDRHPIAGAAVGTIRTGARAVGLGAAAVHWARGDGATAKKIGNSLLAPRTVDEINRAVPPVRAGASIGPMTQKHDLDTKAGNNICNEMRGLSNKAKQSIDRGQFKIHDGVLSGRTTPNKAGQSTGFICIPISSPRNRQEHDYSTQDAPGRGKPATSLASAKDLREQFPGGREIMIGGQAYMMYASGADARMLMTDDGRARKEFRQMSEETGDKIEECKDSNGRATGIYMSQIYNADGSMTKRFWVPNSYYKVDSSLGAFNTQIGGLTYAQFDMQYGFAPNGKPVQAPQSFSSWTEAGKTDWFKQSFPKYKDCDVKNVRYENGVYSASIDGRQMLTFSPAQYGLNPQLSGDASVSKTVGVDGNQYVSVPVPKTNSREGRLLAAASNGGVSASGNTITKELGVAGSPGTSTTPQPQSGSSSEARGGASGGGQSPGVKTPQQGASKQSKVKVSTTTTQQSGGLTTIERNMLYNRNIEEQAISELDEIIKVITPDEKKAEEERKKKRSKDAKGHEEDSSKDADEGRVDLTPIIKETLKRRRSKGSKRKK